ncbi:MAG: hypothetical protein ACI8UP_001323 [Porticoccaceae bacterium]|jgi:hypothetical protein
MKSILPATHLLRQFLLFALTILLLLTVMRAAYSLWLFPKIAEADVFLPLFVQGLRFDLALIGQICIVPVVVGSLLSVTKLTRALAKFVIVLFLTVGLFLVLTLELLTPWFISVQDVRPDLHLFGALENPLMVIKSVFVEHTVPAIIGIAISVMILIAFWIRLELNRFLRYRVFAPTGILFALVGGFACLVAIWSTPDVRQSALSPADSLISRDVAVNDLAMNTTYKTAYSLLSQW